MIHGLGDTALLPGALNNTWDWLDKDLTLVTVPGAGHFVQQDAAELRRQLLGGLALFLYGMEKMTDGLKAAAGKQMNTLLAKLTGNRVLGAITGAIVTSVVYYSFGEFFRFVDVWRDVILAVAVLLVLPRDARSPARSSTGRTAPTRSTPPASAAT